MPKSMNLRAYAFSEYALESILTGKASVVPFPEGVEVVRYAIQWETNSAVLILEHESWESIEPGTSIPVIPVLLELRKK
jgi:hypothetical protein